MAEGGVLTGPEIHRCIQDGRIQVTPFDEKYINPGSIDLTLGDTVAVYNQLTVVGGDMSRLPFKKGSMDLTEEALRTTTRQGGKNLKPFFVEMDAKKQHDVFRFNIDPEIGWVLQPGIGYLMHTAERVWTNRYIPVLDGKSSIGRLFITAHVTAGYGDTGFDGQYTLEVVSQYPVRVYPGMRFCQMRFHTTVGDRRSYHGNYVGDASMGPVPSKAWNQFEAPTPRIEVTEEVGGRIRRRLSDGTD